MPDPTSDGKLLFCLGMAEKEYKNRILSGWTENDWSDLLKQAARHGLSAYLYQRLKDLDSPDFIPQFALDRLREIYLENASRNVRIFHGISKTLGILKTAGIPVIVQKGAHLAEAVYENFALRTMFDLDLLLRRDSISDASARLLDSGFQPMSESGSPWLNWNQEEKTSFLRNAKHFFDIYHPVWKLKVDLHASLARESDPFTIDTDGVWNRAVAARIAGVETLALSPVDSLLYLSLHASVNHQFKFGLRSLIDILETIRRNSGILSWVEVTDRSSQWGVGKSVYLTLSLTRDLLQAPVPETVLDALKPVNMDPKFREVAIRNIFSSNRVERTLPNDLVRLWNSGRWMDRIAALKKSFFPPTHIMALMYPASPNSRRIYLYYPVRWKDLFARWGKTCWGNAIRKKDTIEQMQVENEEVEWTDWLKSGERKR